MKTLAILTTGFLFSVSSFAKVPGYVTSKTKIFLDGYDPVAYFTMSKAVKGKKEFHFTHDSLKIFFTSKKHRMLFAENPEKYLPAYKGWCAYAMAESGKLVEVDPTSFKVVDGKLLLFYNGFWADTLKKWNKKSDTPQFQNANKNWNKLTKGGL